MKKFFNFISNTIAIIIIVFLLFVIFDNIFFNNGEHNDNYYNSELVENLEDDVSTENTNETTNDMTAETISNNRSEAKSFYYNQLDQAGKTLYNAIDNNKENLKTGTYQIKFSKEFDDVLKEENGQEKLITAFHSAWTAYIYDNPELFYIDISKINLSIETRKNLFMTSYSVTIEPVDGESYLAQFDTTDDINTIVAKVDSQINQVVSTLAGSDFNKVKQAHDWLVNNVEYDQGNEINRYDVYGSLINKKAVCEGYAEGLKCILDKAGVDCVIVSGTGTNSSGETEAHEWNCVKIDGKWYGVDATWDDPIIIGWGSLSMSEKYKYLCKGENAFSKNHFADGKIAEKGIEFELPKLNETDYQY